MGLNKTDKTPCGFCFVEYHRRSDARGAMRYINGTRLDDRLIRTDWDPGFLPGRQYGRGKSGGQVRDDFRCDYDEGRGGLGGQMKESMDRILDRKPDLTSVGGSRIRRDSDKALRRDTPSAAKDEGDEPDPKRMKRESDGEEED